MSRSYPDHLSEDDYPVVDALRVAPVNETQEKKEERVMMLMRYIARPPTPGESIEKERKRKKGNNDTKNYYLKRDDEHYKLIQSGNSKVCLYFYFIFTVSLSTNLFVITFVNTTFSIVNKM